MSGRILRWSQDFSSLWCTDLHNAQGCVFDGCYFHDYVMLTLRQGDHLGGPNPINMSPLKAESFLASPRRGSQRFKWEGLDTVIGLKMKGARWQGKRVSSKNWEGPPADSQQGNGDLSPTTSRHSILPIRRMGLEAYLFLVDPADKNLAHPASTLILVLWYREEKTQPCYVDFWPM